MPSRFLLAFRQGKADQYKGFLVKGEGPSLGNSTVTPAGGNPEVALTIIVSGFGADGKLLPIKTTDDWAKARVAREEMLIVELRGPKLQKKQGEKDPQYRFTGTFGGEAAYSPSGDRFPVLENSTAQ